LSQEGNHGGVHPPKALSISSATASVSLSLNLLAMTCTPIGNPLLSFDTGQAETGVPKALKTAA